jgi:hypothetical protein
MTVTQHALQRARERSGYWTASALKARCKGYPTSCIVLEMSDSDMAFCALTVGQNVVTVEHVRVASLKTGTYTGKPVIW